MDIHDDFTLLRELDAIPGEVHDHLSKPRGVPNQIVGNIRRDVTGELDFLIRCLDGNRLERVGDRISKFKIDLFEIEFPCLDFREIENVIEQAQQRSRPTAGRLTDTRAAPVSAPY